MVVMVVVSQRSKCRRLTVALPERVYNADGHRPMRDVDQHRPVGAREPVCLLDGHVVPVAPVHPVLEHRQREHVRHRPVEHQATISAVEVGESTLTRAHRNFQ